MSPGSQAEPGSDGNARQAPRPDRYQSRRAGMSEQDGHERIDVLESDALVSPSGSEVEVVHIEADHRSDRLPAGREDGGHAALGQSLTPQPRVHPDALDLARGRRRGADLSLEDH